MPDVAEVPLDPAAWYRIGKEPGGNSSSSYGSACGVGGASSAGKVGVMVTAGKPEVLVMERLNSAGHVELLFVKRCRLHTCTQMTRSKI